MAIWLGVNMIQSSIVAKTYVNMAVMAKEIEKAEKGEGKNASKITAKPSEKKGLLTRNKMFEPRKNMEESDSGSEEDISVQQQKLVLGYLMRIRKAFEEAREARKGKKNG